MSKYCLALDGVSAEFAIRLVRKLGYLLYAVKIHDLLDAEGPGIIRLLREAGAKRVWVDHKIHDTPGAAALRVRALIANGADIVTVHASGGSAMLEKAVQEARQKSQTAEVWVITVLTSLDARQAIEMYSGESPQQIVHRLAWRAREAGAHGIVCSAQEVGMLAKVPGFMGMRFVVPGTRSTSVILGNQERSGTPSQAIADGATLLVLGSQVTKAEDPVEAFERVVNEVADSVLQSAPL